MLVTRPGRRAADNVFRARPATRIHGSSGGACFPSRGEGARFANTGEKLEEHVHAGGNTYGIGGLMTGASSAQTILNRLIQAEEQVRGILKAAEERAQEAIAQAREQAERSLQAVHQETESALRSRLEEAESNSATERKRRVARAEAEAQEFERRAKEHFSDAVEMVLEWVTKRGD